MSIKQTLSRFVAASSVAALASTAIASNNVDQNDSFYTFYDTVDKWTSGPLGIGLATTMLLMGGAIGVAKNTPMPALSGIAGGAFLTWGPDIILNLMTNGGVL